MLMGVILYFDKDGKQVKGQEREIGGKYYRFDENDGSLLTNQWHHTSLFNGYRTEPQYTTYTNYLGEDGAAFIDGIPLTVNVIISNLMDFWLK